EGGGAPDALKAELAQVHHQQAGPGGERGGRRLLVARPDGSGNGQAVNVPRPEQEVAGIVDVGLQVKRAVVDVVIRRGGVIEVERDRGAGGAQVLRVVV